MRWSRYIFAFYCVFTLFSTDLRAHQNSRAYLNLSLNAKHQLQLDLKIPGRDIKPIADDLGISQNEILQQKKALVSYISQRILIYDSQRQFCKISASAENKSSNSSLLLSLTYQCSEALYLGSKLELRYDLFFQSDPDHRAFLRLEKRLGDIHAPILLDQSHRTYRFGEAHLSKSSLLWRFFRFGNQHIFEGWDHLAFLLAILIGVFYRKEFTLKRIVFHLLLYVSLFTLAHSITLILAAFKVVSLPSLFVESIIAFSVFWLGFEHLIWKKERYRAALIFSFGLIHGFGFAAILVETKISRASLIGALFSFNIGVEAGQLIVTATIFLLLWLVYRYAQPCLNRLLTALSAFVALLGAYWLIARLFFGQ